ncbi:hypothetical protein EMIHUDRAFT_95583 [Emiliania huxleyi CCMP1516]|uniref:Sulfatase N-terminal domain-containing protein n=2 Tax=Emiliania huxleyi TaxID=2903 RepID=A0A0D3JHJ6_EMIH1|nr:hypothetical protein EMIHUDRAFT_95583 [Emiliania huxleyi CCMP1516]EOD22981.1 hypothetical protein EMIHUDRAFT_95583 [Emiliania huxleyi CCMP1516]|eukprot:XP_005775410.1 hypothetical protein EMIHUDRAFT_95583 [Emiliania huxleyi CCMP1516]
MTSLSTPRPNVLIILADDVGIGDISAYTPGAQVATPAISSLAGMGMRFTHAHGHRTCAPSRYELLSGSYVYRGKEPGGMWYLSPAGSQFRPGQRSIAAAFGDAGYDTIMLGKTGIGGFMEQGKSHSLRDVNRLLRGSQRLGDGPAEWGFKRSLTLVSGHQGMPFAFFRGGELSPRNFSTRCWGASISAFDDGVSVTGVFEGGRSRNALVNGTLVRGGGRAASLCDGSNGELHDGTTDWKSHMVDVEIATEMFGFLRPGSSSAAPACTDSSGGLRGFKGSIFEGGHRVPLLLSWPAGGVGAGAASSDLVGLVDLYATLLDLVGAPPPAIGQAVDSVSFKQRLLAPRARGATRRTEHLVWNAARAHPARNTSQEHPAGNTSHGARWATSHWASYLDEGSGPSAARWKLLGDSRGGRLVASALFELASDPGEDSDLLARGRDHPSWAVHCRVVGRMLGGEARKGLVCVREQERDHQCRGWGANTQGQAEPRAPMLPPFCGRG